MQRRLHFVVLFLVCVLLSLSAKSQSCSTLSLQYQSSVNGTCSQMFMTMQQDQMGRPYLYAAAKEGGLQIYDISTLSNPSLVSGVFISSFQGLHVMNVSQDSVWLYLALGNHFGTAKQWSGMAIVDVSDPILPVVSDLWIDSTMNVSGSGIVLAKNNFAYVGAMGNGLVILDVSDKNNIVFASRLMPDITYPQATLIDTAKYNVRGLFVQEDLLFMCYDRGGFRIVSVADKLNPLELGKYSNPMLNGIFMPRAYNNVIVNNHLAYVTIDYCGLEILDISDSLNISLVSWWNPWNCPGTNPVAQWNTSDGHTNELALDSDCDVLFISTGKSDMYVVDVSNPLLPDSCGFYGGVSNNLGTWGISSAFNKVFLSYICTFGIPFPSLNTKIDILNYNACALGLSEQYSGTIEVFPLPATDHVFIRSAENQSVSHGKYTLRNVFGKIVDAGELFFDKQNIYSLDIQHLNTGIYFLSMYWDGQDGMITHKIFKL